MHNKTIIGFFFSRDSENYQGFGLCYPPQPSASADNTNLSLDNSCYHAQPYPIIVNWHARTVHNEFVLNDKGLLNCSFLFFGFQLVVVMFGGCRYQ